MRMGRPPGGPGMTGGRRDAVVSFGSVRAWAAGQAHDMVASKAGA